MEQNNLKISILPNLYLKDDGTFDKESAINFCGKIAGICYSKEDFSHLENESIEKTNRRINMTLNNGHHSVYDHVTINFYLQNVPKILAMVINNEHQYTTSEKSLRYTPVVKQENSIITEKEALLYNKWIDVFKSKIQKKYGHILKESKIQTLAQENSRSLVTVFMPTQLIYSTSLRQINYIASWMMKYINTATLSNSFENKLVVSMEEFLDELKRLNVLEDALLKNEKDRSFSLFGKDLNKKQEYFGDTYSTIYKESFAALAQAQRHRTLHYKFEFMEKKEYFIPPIISDGSSLVSEWLNDMNEVKDVHPIGELVTIYEIGKYEDFILKCKERLCSAAQLEVMEQSRNTLLKYKKSLEDSGNPLANDIEKYSHGARCTFPDFTCNSDCNFKEGKLLTRKI